MPTIAEQHLLSLARSDDRTKTARIAELLPTINAARAAGVSLVQVCAALKADRIEVTAAVLAAILRRLDVSDSPGRPVPRSRHASQVTAPSAASQAPDDHRQMIDQMMRSTPDLNALARRYKSTNRTGKP